MTAWNLTDLADVPKNGLTVMSTFACGGGSSMGYKLAGFDVIAGNDIDPQMAWHYKANMRPRYFFQMPIKQLVALARARKLPECLYNLDVLDGSPPCSSFSMSGSRDKKWGKASKFREGQQVQVLDDLFFDYLDLADALKPRVSVAENVKGLITGKAKGYVSSILSRYRSFGYRSQMFLLDANDHGVAQHRRRVFFVATRDANAPISIAYGERGLSINDVCDGVTRNRATRVPSPKTLALWSAAHLGESYDKTSSRLGLGNSSFSRIKADPSQPCPTLTSYEDVHHWKEPRSLSIGERIRIGSFPDDYVFKSHKIGIYMIGMSVPPFLARAVAVAIRDQWLT